MVGEIAYNSPVKIVPLFSSEQIAAGVQRVAGGRCRRILVRASLCLRFACSGGIVSEKF